MVIRPVIEGRARGGESTNVRQCVTFTKCYVLQSLIAVLVGSIINRISKFELEISKTSAF